MPGLESSSTARDADGGPERRTATTEPESRDGTPGAPAPSMLRRVLNLAGGALLVLLLLVWIVRLEVRLGATIRAHNRLVETLNRERTGLGAVLDAAGVPAGKIIGAALDGLAGPDGAPRRRRGRR